jgi:hypothetical protein
MLCLHTGVNRCGPKRRKAPAVPPHPPALRTALPTSVRGSGSPNNLSNYSNGHGTGALADRSASFSSASSGGSFTGSTNPAVAAAAASAKQSPAASLRSLSSIPTAATGAAAWAANTGSFPTAAAQGSTAMSAMPQQLMSQQQQQQQAQAPPLLLSSDERHYLGVFTSAINSFTPIASVATLREAMNPAPLDIGVASMAPRAGELSRFHACKVHYRLVLETLCHAHVQ